MTKRALLLIDVQNDFCPNGSLPVPNGDQVIPVINALRHRLDWDLIVLTQDYHPAGHISFASSHDGAAVFSTVTLDDGTEQVMWPDHCVQETMGAEFHPQLITDDGNDVIVTKGTDPKIDSYSGFFDNARRNQTDLDHILKEEAITDVYVMGLALDYCVKFTSLDAVDLGYKTFLVQDACRGIDKVDEAIEEMKKAGVTVVQSSDISF